MRAVMACAAVAALAVVAAAVFSSGTSASGTPGTIDTVAGGNASLGDGGPATSAWLNQPVSVTVDASDNLFISDSFNCRIRELSSGTITTFAGDGSCSNRGDGGAATGAGINGPAQAAVDASGNVYVADLVNCTVRKISSGIITTVAGNGVCSFSGDGGPATSASLAFPEGVAVSGGGDIYIADQGNCRIRLVSGGTITTVAGTGTCGFSGDEGTAVSSQLSGPFGIAMDGVGDLYIADNGNCRVRKVSGGTITTVVGTGTCAYSGDGGAATAAALNHPTMVAFDSSGNLYIADSVNCRVREVSGGTITTVAGNGSCFFTGDGGSATSAGMIPTGVALDSLGNLYIADYFDCRVRQVSGGVITTVAGHSSCVAYGGDGGAATSGALSQPRGVAVDNSGNLYLSDSYDCRIRKVSNTGTISNFSGTGNCFNSPPNALNQPAGITVDSGGMVYVADTQNCVVRQGLGGTLSVVAGNGTCGYGGDGGAPTSASLAYPSDVAIYGGELYIADTFNCRVRKVSGPTITTVAGNGTCGYSGDGGGATTAALNQPSGLAFDAAGNLYIADNAGCRVRKVAGGTISTIAGNGICGYGGDGGAATSAELNKPVDIVVDVGNNVFITDGGNCRVRRVGAGTITTVAGTGTCGFGGDGGAAGSSPLAAPSGITIDSGGNLYVADTQNNRVRELYAQGYIPPTPTPTATPTATPAPSGFTVSGHVYYGKVGDGLPGASVTLCEDGGGPCHGAVTSGTDGAYVIANVTAGSYDITAVPGGTLGPVAVSGNTPGQDILYAPTGAIGGFVYHDSAQPQNVIAGARVLACLTIEGASGVCLPAVTSAADGSYLVQFAPDGTYTLSVYPGTPYFATSATGVTVTSGGPASQDLIVTGPPTGSISGHVYHDSADGANALAGVAVYACPITAISVTACSRSFTDAGGAYTVGQLADGAYIVAASPPDPYNLGTVNTSVASGGATSGQDIIVLTPEPKPTDVDLPTSTTTTNGQPMVDWSQPAPITRIECPGGAFTWHMTMTGLDVTGPMTEGPSGVYTGTLPAVEPLHGDSLVTITGSCPQGPPPSPEQVTVYHDPSGLVRDTAGNAIAGATVTLWQSDSPDGPFTQVPNGSVIMSPGNRADPDITDANGHFGWDVVAAYYKVRASMAGCVAPGNAAQPYAESGVMAIPPPVTDLDLRLDCTDTDSDGLPNSYELAHGCLDPTVADESADADGDGVSSGQEYTLGTDPCKSDTDGDGCGDGAEVGASHTAGGQRDPNDPWDFYDVPAPALRLGYTGQARDHGIGLGTDVLALLAYTGMNSGDAVYIADADGNGIEDGLQYDRSVSTTPGEPWQSGPPDGGIGLGTDVLAMLAQTGNTCS